jgi:hypothetical protein
MKTLWSVILALLMLAGEAAVAALITIAPVKALRARGGDDRAAPIRQGSRLVARLLG